MKVVRPVYSDFKLDPRQLPTTAYAFFDVERPSLMEPYSRQGRHGGDRQPAECAEEMEKVRPAAFGRVRRFLRGRSRRREIGSEVYSFDVIPLEFISNAKSRLVHPRGD